MSDTITKEIFDTLLYISRLDATGEERTALQNQIASIVGYFKELEKFRNDSLEATDCSSNSEKDLRTSLSHIYVEARSLKVINNEFMDGYFRTPKVLGSS
ncbi:MAG: Asp-tRNA(Asn)/Glu-tRNA(Gln) amidotransferase subunit GatC [Treponema sp.]